MNGFRVDWDLTIKISDFGLARALEKEQDYYRNTPGKAGLAIRWVALEGISEGIFTTKSDVVSQVRAQTRTSIVISCLCSGRMALRCGK